MSSTRRRAAKGLKGFWEEDSESAAEEKDVFLSWVARAIVVVSILGALISWRASQSSGSADGLNQQSLRDANFEELARNEIRAFVSHDLSLLGEFEESWVREARISEELRFRPGSQRLRVERLQELRHYQTLDQFFWGSHPTLNPKKDLSAENDLIYQPDYIAHQFEANDPTLQEVRPEEEAAAGKRARTQTVGYVRAAAMLAAALFFLTLAMLIGRGLRRKMAIIGLLITAAAVVQYILA
jgi:hypothetical protein